MLEVWKQYQPRIWSGTHERPNRHVDFFIEALRFAPGLSPVQMQSARLSPLRSGRTMTTRMRACTAAFLFVTFCGTVSPFTHAPMPCSSFVARMASGRRSVPATPRLGSRALVCSTVENDAVVTQGAMLRKPSIDVEQAQLAQKPQQRVRREVVDTIYQTLDINGDGAISKEEFLDGMHGLDFAASEEASAELFSADEGTISGEEFYSWVVAGGEVATSLVSKWLRDQATALFKEIDTDGSGDIDADEMHTLAMAMGMRWTKKQSEAFIATVDADASGTINFEEFNAWYFEQSSSTSVSVASAAGAQLRLMLRSGMAVDTKRVLVKGVPLKANEAVVKRFFGRCGDIEDVKALPWARDGRPSGRNVITFADKQGVANALKMHRKHMGPRYLEVYRVNQGDTEERLALDKKLHSAVIGVDGAHLQRMELESSARVFLRSNETDGWVVIKGTAKEREAAKAMILEQTGGANAGGIESEVVPIAADQQGLVIGKGGRTIVRLEAESGAKLEVRAAEAEEEEEWGVAAGAKAGAGAGAGSARVVVSGLPWARNKARGLLSELLETSGAESFDLKSKYHGTLKGKQGALVQAVQEATDSLVQFDATGGSDNMGAVKIRAPARIRQETWALIQQLQKEVPAVLALLRGAGVEAGDLLSRPGFVGAVPPEEVWAIAAKEAIARAQKALAVAK